MEYVTVQDEEVPAIGLGTWQMDDDEAYEAVRTALDLGYRHIDTAQLYENEAAVGRAIADTEVDRDDVFLVTKVNPRKARTQDVVQSTMESLQRLQTDYVDLLLLHWPMPLLSFAKTARGFKRLRDGGHIRHAGVSNFRTWRLKRAVEKSPVPILADQVRLNPHYTHETLREYARTTDTLVTAYSPLGTGTLVDDEVCADIGAKYDKTAAQVALRWATQFPRVVAIPKSTTERHLRANLEIFDFTLTQAEHDRIARPSYLQTAKQVVGV
ncbi:MAG: aldo/keto reductase [Haloarculaceae archaeon]